MRQEELAMAPTTPPGAKKDVEELSPGQIFAAQSNVGCAFCPLVVADGSRLYTCPKCQRRYCGLGCYRSQGHLDCSEAFYKSCVDGGLREAGRQPRPVPAFLTEALRPDADDPVLAAAARSDSPGPGDAQGQAGEEREEGEASGEEDDEAYLRAVSARVEATLETGEAAEDLEAEMERLGLGAAGPDHLLRLLSPKERAAFQQLLENHADQVDFQEEEDLIRPAAPAKSDSCFRKTKTAVPSQPRDPEKKPKLL